MGGNDRAEVSGPRFVEVVKGGVVMVLAMVELSSFGSKSMQPGVDHREITKSTGQKYECRIRKEGCPSHRDLGVPISAPVPFRGFGRLREVRNRVRRGAASPNLSQGLRRVSPPERVESEPPSLFPHNPQSIIRFLSCRIFLPSLQASQLSQIAFV